MTMAAPIRRVIRAGDSLPRLSFRQVAAPGCVSWNQGTTASVVFVPHRGDCIECRAYADGLATAVSGLREWATRAMVLVGTSSVVTSGLHLLADEDDAVRGQLGLRDEQAAVIQADRWGAVYQVEVIGPGGPGHRELPAPRDLEALAQFIDIQCPECGVPSREWLGATAFPLG